MAQGSPAGAPGSRPPTPPLAPQDTAQLVVLYTLVCSTSLQYGFKHNYGNGNAELQGSQRSGTAARYAQHTERQIRSFHTKRVKGKHASAFHAAAKHHIAHRILNDC